MKYTRITIDPAVCGGKPCIRGLRFPVSRLLGLLASGEDRQSIVKAYPYLEEGDIDEALRYAADLADRAHFTPEERTAAADAIRQKTKGIAPSLTLDEIRDGLE